MTNWKEHITTDKDILLGKPVIKGTRLSVDHLIGLLAQGWSEKQVLDNFPRLTQNDLKTIFKYIQECMKDGLFYELPKQTAKNGQKQKKFYVRSGNSSQELEIDEVASYVKNSFEAI